jgi:hypothetical protein
MLVEGDCLIVFGVNHERKGGGRGFECPARGIRQQGCTQASAAKPPIDGQAADAHRRYRRVAGQTFDLLAEDPA